jgi:AcrR family transcriptional regulator
MKAARLSPRERLVETAGELFYRRGLPNVGINEVTDTAGVARMTLYNNFASKEDLALAVFKLRAEQRRSLFLDYVERQLTPVAKTCALFDAAEAIAVEEGFRGCAFINLALEVADPASALHAVALAHKKWIWGMLADLAKSAGVTAPDVLAQQIVALWDGSIVEAYLQRNADPIKFGKMAARTLFQVAAPR